MKRQISQQVAVAKHEKSICHLTAKFVSLTLVNLLTFVDLISMTLLDTISYVTYCNFVIASKKFNHQTTIAESIWHKVKSIQISNHSPTQLSSFSELLNLKTVFYEDITSLKNPNIPKKVRKVVVFKCSSVFVKLPTSLVHLSLRCCNIVNDGVLFQFLPVSLEYLQIEKIRYSTFCINKLVNLTEVVLTFDPYIMPSPNFLQKCMRLVRVSLQFSCLPKFSADDFSVTITSLKLSWTSKSVFCACALPTGLTRLKLEHPNLERLELSTLPSKIEKLSLIGKFQVPRVFLLSLKYFRGDPACSLSSEYFCSCVYPAYFQNVESFAGLRKLHLEASVDEMILPQNLETLCIDLKSLVNAIGWPKSLISLEIRNCGTNYTNYQITYPATLSMFSGLYEMILDGTFEDFRRFATSVVCYKLLKLTIQNGSSRFDKTQTFANHIFPTVRKLRLLEPQYPGVYNTNWFLELDKLLFLDVSRAHLEYMTLPFPQTLRELRVGNIIDVENFRLPKSIFCLHLSAQTFYKHKKFQNLNFQAASHRIEKGVIVLFFL